MITQWARLRAVRGEKSQEGGYVAVMTGLLLMVLMGLAAFAVDVGQWYLVGQQEQRAADAAALAGVTSLPGDPPGAFLTAKHFSKINGFADGPAITVATSIDTKPTRLRVTVSRTVDNFFGPLLGVPNTTITRTAVADYAGPVPLGSPCNEFGNDPDEGGNKSTNCADTGAFWANVGSKKATKVSGDAFQDNVCNSGNDGCSGSTNTDYDPDGYFYTVTLAKPVTNLTIQAFDPAQIVVGDHCKDTNANKLTEAAALGAKAVVGDASTRYAPDDGPWCTGDTTINGTNGLVKTQFTVHDPGVNPWDPKNWPIDPGVGCQRTFEPFNGDLSLALDQTQLATFRPDVAANFRRWVDLCSIPGTVPAGTYAIQVKTNDLGADGEGGHNRFALRAFGSAGDAKDAISVAGFNKMAMYGNTPNGTSRFFLAKVPSGAKGQLFNVHLFDIGDGATSGSTIKVLPPKETGGTFTGCIGKGPVLGTGNLPDCQISVNSSYNGKWETISVPIPPSYTCDDLSATGCWVRLQFYYGPDSSANDTTSWTASIEGDPVRLVE